MGRLRIIGAEEEQRWRDVLARSSQYDFFHLPRYHLLAEKRGEGKAQLFLYEEGDRFIALPLLLRPVEKVQGLEQIGQGWLDATSVYGYAGPVASQSELEEEFLNGFRRALSNALKEMRVVAVFSRLHPLIEQKHILSGLGECLNVGCTVSIDLTLPPEVQFSQYRQGHRYEMNRLKKQGAVCEIDTEFNHLDDFVAIYRETMKQRDAAEFYYFDDEFFHTFANMPEAHLFLCKLNEELMCAGLFTICNGVVQYFLSGTRHKFMKLAPTKLLIDEVRIWAIEQKAKVFHLGGGVGSKEDSLFQFKAGFSDRRHDFAVWRWIVEPEVYENLCRAKQEWNRRNGFICETADYFPAYRAPARKGSG